MKYGIGLDCGIASVGYAVMQLDENDDPCRIIRLGSRVFNKAENPQDGASLAAPRREARGMRRRIRRQSAQARAHSLFVGFVRRVVKSGAGQFVLRSAQRYLYAARQSVGRAADRRGVFARTHSFGAAPRVSLEPQNRRTR